LRLFGAGEGLLGALLRAIEIWERQRPMRDLIRVVESAQVKQRWLVAIGAILVQVCLGAIYAWSVFTGKLTDPNGDFHLSTAQTQWIFSVGLAMFALMTVVFGRLQERSGPRPIAILGGLMLGAGYILAGLFGKSFLVMLLCVGVLSGAGIGLAYVVPIAVGIRWFPDKKGLITGLAVAGFGFGALLWVQLAGSWGSLLDSAGVLTTLLIYGIVFALVVHIGGLFMSTPPDGWRPTGWTPPEEAGEAAGGPSGVDMPPRGMLRTPQFYLIWLAFIFAAMAGLMLIGINKLYGRDALFAADGYANREAAGVAASTAYAVAFALANGAGRIGWGAIADRLGWRPSIVLMAATQGALMFAFYFVGGNLAGLWVVLALTGFNFGGNFALFPLATANQFGAGNIGRNYGFVFTAYGVGGIAGPVMAAVFKDAADPAAGVAVWRMPFMIAGGLCAVAALLVLMVRPIRAEGEEATAA